MQTQCWIAFFRGINVGGKGKLPMAELKAALEKLGLKDSKTYIQSGNVVFRGPKTQAAKLAHRISSAISKSHGFQPHVILLTHGQLQKALEANPFPIADGEEKTLHLFFLSEPPLHADRDGLNAAKLKSERWKIVDNVFYLHAPDGFGKSKLAARAEKLLGVSATARNWRTITNVMGLANEMK